LSCSYGTLPIKDKIKIEYVGFKKAGLTNKYHFGLYFSIINISKDTLYLSKKHLSVICKNGKSILNDNPLVYEPQPFVMPQKVPTKEIEKKDQQDAKKKFCIKNFAL
jgi:hypothetical protein